jgi:hypothetical protein
MQNNNKYFFSGQEEVIARTVSLIFNLILFGAYSLAKGEQVYNWQLLILTLGIFWFVYEGFSLILFNLFNFFSTKTDQIMKEIKPIPVENETEEHKNQL